MNAEQRERLQQALDFVEHASAEELDSALERADYHYWKNIGPIVHGPEDLVILEDLSSEDELLEYELPFTWTKPFQDASDAPSTQTIPLRADSLSREYKRAA